MPYLSMNERVRPIPTKHSRELNNILRLYSKKRLLT
ncbi:hypothetical protein GC56T2_0985 [Geobacillus sp. C56-T2]|nr:hypothetical protein GC56T2_0985 [Geobacillus sp. C56-T2]